MPSADPPEYCGVPGALVDAGNAILEKKLSVRERSDCHSQLLFLSYLPELLAIVEIMIVFPY